MTNKQDMEKALEAKREMRYLEKIALGKGGIYTPPDYGQGFRDGAAFNAAQSQSGWSFDMGAAPRDGTWIEVFRGPADFGVCSRVAFIKWHSFDDEDDPDPNWRWPDRAYEIFSEEGRTDAEEAISKNCEYYEGGDWTHWRMPQPPEGG